MQDSQTAINKFDAALATLWVVLFCFVLKRELKAVLNKMRRVTSLWPKWNNNHSKLLSNKKQEEFLLIFFLFICLFICFLPSLNVFHFMSPTGLWKLIPSGSFPVMCAETLAVFKLGRAVASDYDFSLLLWECYSFPLWWAEFVSWEWELLKSKELQHPPSGVQWLLTQ